MRLIYKKPRIIQMNNYCCCRCDYFDYVCAHMNPIGELEKSFRQAAPSEIHYRAAAQPLCAGQSAWSTTSCLAQRAARFAQPAAQFMCIAASCAVAVVGAALGVATAAAVARVALGAPTIALLGNTWR